MPFTIQVSNPLINDCTMNEEVEDLSEAIQTIFPMNTEDAYVLWNWIPIRLNYKYDLSVLIDDLIPLLNDLIKFDKGSYDVYFGSNTFSASWILNWNEGQLTIIAHWDRIAGNYEEVLNTRSQLSIDQKEFLQEWKPLLGKIINTVDKAGITITDQYNLKCLKSIEAAIVVPSTLSE